MRRSRGAGAKRLQGGHGDGERARGGGEYREYRRGATPNRRYHKRHGVRTLEPTKFFVLVALVREYSREAFFLRCTPAPFLRHRSRSVGPVPCSASSALMQRRCTV